MLKEDILGNIRAYYSRNIMREQLFFKETKWKIHLFGSIFLNQTIWTILQKTGSGDNFKPMSAT